LIVAGVSIEISARVLTALADAVIEGDRFEVGEHVSARGHAARIGAVDEVQYDLDTFAMWYTLRSEGVLEAPRLSAVQVVVAQCLCPAHRSQQPILSDPAARVGAPLGRENRAARRRRPKR
jgi:hypothetical protein